MSRARTRIGHGAAHLRLLALLLAATTLFACGRDDLTPLAQINAREGAAYLQANARRPGVLVRPSGLQVEIERPGEGRQPAKGDRVRVHYRGTLIDGRVFDDTRQRATPAELAVDRLVPGFREGLGHLHEGGRARLVIPGELAYGEAGVPGVIGPNATLVFEVELLEVLPSAGGNG